MERKTKISDPDGKKLFKFADDIAKIANPQRWFDGANEEVPEVERKSALFLAKDKMGGLLEGGLVRDFVNKLKIDE